MEDTPSIPLPDLGVLVKELAENVQTAMVSLYDLQNSFNNTAIADPHVFRSVFSELRKQLREQWEELRVYLQRCHAFGEDVSTLQDAFGTEDVADCLEFLTDMADSAKELRSPNNKDVSAAFQSVKDLHTSTPRNNAIRRPSTGGRREVRDKDSQTFVDANVHAANPNGEQSLSDLDGALAGIKSKLDACSQFWTTTSQQCRAYLKVTTSGRPSITPNEVEGIIESWTRYQECIEGAIVSITKTSDAMLVEPAAAVVRKRFRLIRWWWPFA